MDCRTSCSASLSTLLSNTRHPLRRSLDGPYNLPGRSTEKKYISLPGTEHRSRLYSDWVVSALLQKVYPFLQNSERFSYISCFKSQREWGIFLWRAWHYVIMSDIWPLSSAAYAQEAINLHFSRYQAKPSQAKYCLVASLFYSYREREGEVTVTSVSWSEEFTLLIVRCNSLFIYSCS